MLNLSDEELTESIQEALDDDGRIQTDMIEIEVVNGKPYLRGRVSSDEELQVVDEIMTDVLEIEDYSNTIWVDDSLAFEGSSNDEDGNSSIDLDDDGDLDDDFTPDEDDD